MVYLHKSYLKTSEIMHCMSEGRDLPSGCCSDRGEAVRAVKQLTVGHYERHRWAKNQSRQDLMLA